VYYKRGDGTKEGWDTTKVTGTSFISPGNDTKQSFYTFTVFAINASGSEIAKADIKYNMPKTDGKDYSGIPKEPSVISGLKAEKGADATQVKLSWNAFSGASYYKVYYKRGDGTKEGWDTTKVTGTSFISPGNDTKQSFYTFTVFAVNPSGSEIAKADIKYIMPSVPLPTPPLGTQYYWHSSFNVYQQSSYGPDMSNRGCGPTSLANAIRYYTNRHGNYRDVNPKEVFDKTVSENLFSSGGVYIWGMASNSNIQRTFRFTAKEIFGINNEKTSARKTEAVNKLKSGSVFLVSAPNYYYNSGGSGGGHVTAIGGYSAADNKTLILDSYNRTTNYDYNRSYLTYPNARDFDKLWSSITCMYEIIPN
jgi:hypothetical protein